MIIGQDKLLQQLDKYTLANFPRSAILLGPKGCGKHLVANYLAEKFNAEVIDLIPEMNGDRDKLDDIFQGTTLRIVMTTASELTLQASARQNMILKYIEEPFNSTITIILCDDRKQLLSTILNRCQIFEFEKYSKEVLAQFADGNTNILEVAKTPGQVIQLKSNDFNNIISLANLIFDKINIASLPNTLTLSNRITFNGEQDKFDIDLFIDVLMYTITKKIIESNDARLLAYYELTNKLSRDRYLPNINKQYLFENYLVRLREI